MTERAEFVIGSAGSMLPGRSNRPTRGERPRCRGRGGHRRRLLVAVLFAVLTATAGAVSAPAVDAAAPTGDHPPRGGSLARITAGSDHTCALTAAGGIRCWGTNWAGQLGDGTTNSQTTPVDVVGLGARVRSVDAGWNFTCAVTRSGGAKCWGVNHVGQVGDGTITFSQPTPVDVVGLGSGVSAISAGGLHACALTTRGGVKCWGLNNAGQLGDGTTTDSPTPVDVVGFGSGVVAISAGAGHTCAVTRRGRVMCWGSNFFGQLGDGSTTDRLTPVEVVGMRAPASTVVAGESEPIVDSHTCAVTVHGGVMCWGSNWAGQLGDGTTTGSPTPVDVVGLARPVVAVGAGSASTCALVRARGVLCWGGNVFGQLGDGTTTDSPTPVPVASLRSRVAQIAVGRVHACVLTTSGGVKCWGSNGTGQLGDGTGTNRSTPVDVSGSFYRPECPTLVAAPHTTFTLSRGYAVGSVATFTADSGYALVGPASLRCRGDRSWSGLPPTAEGTGSVTVIPSTGLVDGQTVTVTMAGFPALGTVGWCQGVPLDPASSSNCGGPIRTGQTDASGGLTDPSYPVARFIFVPILGRTVDCAAEACVIGAADVTDLPGSVVNAFLSFSPTGPPE